LIRVDQSLQRSPIRREVASCRKAFLQPPKLFPAFDCDPKVDVARRAAWPQPMNVRQNEIPRRRARHEVTAVRFARDWVERAKNADD
jgi:hypothetical protein